MSIHDGAPLIAKTICLWDKAAKSEIELTNGEVVIWTGVGALAIARQLAESVKAGRIRTIQLPSPEGEMHEVHVGPDVAIVHEEGGQEKRKQ